MKWALYALFAIPGVSLATWATRTPALRDTLSASTEQMGFILLGFSLGSMGGVLSGASLTGKLGARLATLLGLGTLVGGLGLMGVGAYFGSPILAFGGFFLFGLGMGWAELSMNLEAAALEARSGWSLLPIMHGCFSVGTLIGAAVGFAMTALGVGIALHALLIAVVGLACLVPLVRCIGNLSLITQHDAGPAGAPAGKLRVIRQELKDSKLLMLGVAVLAMAFAEGSANDWLALLMVDGYGFTSSQGTLIYTLFIVGMLVGRFSGSWLVARFAKRTILQACAVLAAIGVGMAIFATSPAWGAGSVLLWGLGASLGFPIAISAAGDGERNASVRVAIVSTLGYTAFLVGPPSLGLLGEEYGLRLAMLPVLCLTCVAFVVCAVGGRRDARA